MMTFFAGVITGVVVVFLLAIAVGIYDQFSDEIYSEYAVEHHDMNKSYIWEWFIRKIKGEQYD